MCFDVFRLQAVCSWSAEFGVVQVCELSLACGCGGEVQVGWSKLGADTCQSG